MILKAKFIGLQTGEKAIVLLNGKDAEELGIKSLGRVKLSYRGKEIVAIANLTDRIVKKGYIGLSERVKKSLGMEKEEEIEVEVAKFPKSLEFIKKKLDGRKLSYEEFYEIVNDVITGSLSEGEIASFVSGLYTKGLDLDEAARLSLAMVDTGEKLELKKKFILDKHCLPADTPLLISEGGEIKVKSIGETIDNIFKKCAPHEIERGENYEFTDKNLGGLKVLVHDENGEVNFAEVSGVFRVKPPKFLEEIELLGNRKIRCTSDHTIFVLKKGKILNIPARKIKVGDYVVVPSGFSNDKLVREISFKEFENRRNYRDLPTRIKITPELMRLLGYYISEGFTNSQGVFFNFGSHEVELINDCINCVRNVFGFSPTINYPHPTTTRICLYSKAISQMFNQIIKVGKNSVSKKIPGFLFNVPDEMKIEFLKALFLGDGYKRRGYEEVYVTISRDLAIGLAYFLSLMGISVTISERSKGERLFSFKDGEKSSQKPKKHMSYTHKPEKFLEVE